MLWEGTHKIVKEKRGFEPLTLIFLNSKTISVI
jgi:hypothetical protein